MTETPPEAPEPEDTTQPASPGKRPVSFDAPADTPEAIATGYKVYDRTLGRYVGPTTDKRPSAADARKAVPAGHTAAVVRV